MFEKYIIVEKETKNIFTDGKPTGFQVGARVPYYRGLGISMIEDIKLSVDGNTVSPDKILVELHGNKYTLAAMQTEADDRWEFGEVGILKVQQPGGLAPGNHKITLAFTLRISYMPVIAVREDSKVLSV
ncbi:MAG: hypothetical protein JST75_01605 [Bacteroidetes bacterium]|nr:hypothetical protein [Bacteroidota bacterium]